jgi:hypothetical protein
MSKNGITGWHGKSVCRFCIWVPLGFFLAVLGFKLRSLQGRHSTAWVTSSLFAVLLFPTVAVQFYIPTNYCAQRFQFLCILLTHYFFWIFFIVAILMRMKWFLTAVLICISLMISEISIFMCFCISSLEKYLLRYFGPGMIGLFILLLSYKNSLSYEIQVLQIISLILWAVFFG